MPGTGEGRAIGTSRPAVGLPFCYYAARCGAISVTSRRTVRGRWQGRGAEVAGTRRTPPVRVRREGERVVPAEGCSWPRNSSTVARTPVRASAQPHDRRTSTSIAVGPYRRRRLVGMWELLAGWGKAPRTLVWIRVLLRDAPRVSAPEIAARIG